MGTLVRAAGQYPGQSDAACTYRSSFYFPFGSFNEEGVLMA